MSRDHARNTPIAVGQMWCDPQPPRPADAHAFDAVEQAVDERPSVNPDLREQRLAVVVEPGDVRRSRCDLPANRFALVQPETQTDSIPVLAPHELARPGHVNKQRQTPPETFVNGLPP